ncbi:nucleophosmin 1 [Microdochium nivale]|nr:nucleophosmin 1 [Microdochium nivale]
MSRDISPTSKVAYVEEVNEEDDPISRRTYAKSTVGSPSKERSNTGRSRKGPMRHSATSPPDSYDEMSDENDNSAMRREAKSRPRDPKKSSKSGPVVVSKHAAPPPKRPGVRQSKTTGHIPARSMDDPSYYGVPPQPQTIVSRPRSRTRPESYYGQTARQGQRGPPMSQSAYFNGGQPPPGSFGPPPFGPPGMFNGPPPHMTLPMHGGPPGPPHGPPHGHPHGYPHGPPHGQPHGQPHPMDYQGGGPRELSARFGRPNSSMGFRPPSSYEPEPMPERAIARKPSASRKPSKDHDARTRMPPPARPASARPSASGGDRLVFKAPPQQSMRRKSRPQLLEEDDDDDDFEEDDAVVYRPDPRRVSSAYGASSNPFASRRRDSFEGESDNDLAIYKREPPGHGRRRSSQFHGAIDEKTRKAMSYQDGILTHGAPLTAETLKYAQNGGSSRSTRSAESRDESDWKHSATTRTTRSSNEEDDITIKLPRGGVIEVAGAKITCADGGDVNIGRGNRHGNDNATERDSATVHDDDDDDEEEEDEEDEEDDYHQPLQRRKSRTMRTQKRIQAEPHVASYPRSRDPRSMPQQAALPAPPSYNNYAPSSYGSGRRTPGPRGGQQTGVYDPYPYAQTFDDDEEYDDDQYYAPPPPSAPGYYPQYSNY